jgi:hypothetical protein
VAPEPEQPPQPGRLTAFVTNVPKLVGVAIAFNETLVRHEPRSIALGIAALLISGTRVLETFIDRLFGGG